MATKSVIVNPHEAALAYGEYLDSLVPEGYTKREVYQSFPPPIRATVRPPTGVVILDLPGPASCSQVTAGMSKCQLQSMAEHEARVGLSHDSRRTKKK